MSKLEPNRSLADAVARLDGRIEHTLGQCRRFETLADLLDHWASRWSTSTLARWLNLDQLPIEEREKALVALALQGTAASGIVLDNYHPAGRGHDHRVLYEVARIEWETRHRNDSRRRPMGHAPTG